MTDTPLPNYHGLLVSQLRETLGEAPNVSEPFRQFLRLVSETYAKYEDDQIKLVNEVKLRTNQLIDSTSKAYLFLDSLNMGFIMCDVNSEIVLTNSSIRKILTSKIMNSSQDAIDEFDWSMGNIDRLLMPGLPLRKLVQECIKTSQTKEIKDVAFGSKFLHVSLAPMTNRNATGTNQQIGAVILFDDITDQKMLERSKDEFLSIASHELRTPLTAIKGNTYLLKKYYADSLSEANIGEMIEDIYESSDRLINIVNDFLDVSALEQGKINISPVTFDLIEVANRVLGEMKPAADAKALSLTCDQSVAGVPSVKADKQKAYQVVYNLVNNAVKFTSAGNVSISAHVKDGFVVVSVTDTGMGIPSEYQKLLFRKFQQASSSPLTRDASKGTGLGLYICKLIVNLSGGHIWLEKSEPGRGSTFTFTLPVA